MYQAPRLLVAIVCMIVLSSFASLGTTVAQGSEEPYTAVCVVGFESPVVPRYLTDAEITELEALVQDPFEPMVPEIVGYPDPLTGSCATKNGELIDYNPEGNTPICIPSGRNFDGPLVVILAITHYLPGYEDPILADPVTGACPDQPDDTDTLIEALIAILLDILREALR